MRKQVAHVRPPCVRTSPSPPDRVADRGQRRLRVSGAADPVAVSSRRRVAAL